MTLTLKQITDAAHKAANEYFQDTLGGRDRLPCGFAWVRVYPKFKGNTQEGREERKELRRLGFEKNYTSRVFELWNPSGLPVQNVDVKYVGAQAAADLMQEHGFTAYPGQRLD